MKSYAIVAFMIYFSVSFQVLGAQGANPFPTVHDAAASPDLPDRHHIATPTLDISGSANPEDFNRHVVVEAAVPDRFTPARYVKADFSGPLMQRVGINYRERVAWLDPNWLIPPFEQKELKRSYQGEFIGK